MKITIEITRNYEGIEPDIAGLERLVRYVCESFGLAEVTVSIGVGDDVEIGVFNERFLSHEGPTDCISFDLSDGQGPEEPRVFDLIVNGQLAQREAAQRGHSAEAELALYVTHGLLHQLGYDDATAEQAEAMHGREDEILQHLGYGFVYNTGPRSR